MTRLRRRLVVRGIVQGVGFRPFVARIADELALTGTCHNESGCVVIEVEGPREAVERFAVRLEGEHPRMAQITSVESADFAPASNAASRSQFIIDASSTGSGPRTMVPPDTALCDDCRHEFHDQSDRRFHHPFITCTNCGPRLTITHDLPYDRPATSMADFALCVSCARDYADPRNRRYHAQPIGCHDCGPKLSLVDTKGCALDTDDPTRVVAQALNTGSIVAIKGLGGFHLACDAADDQAVATLRERKARPDQPFAVMAADLDTARSFVDIPDAAADLLSSPAHPIVVLPASPQHSLSSQVAPGPPGHQLDEFGVLLPYTGIHELLFTHPECPRVLVMTSANLSGEPLCFTDDQVFERLSSVVDLVLTHDRDIVVPCEDSVIAWSPHGPVPLRRSRGYAPLPIPCPDTGAGVVLAAGAELKNTFALARDGQVFCSGHIGDLGTIESHVAQRAATDQLLRFHRATPDLVVCDQHPGYVSRVWAHEFADRVNAPIHEVQHHHAHLASLAAEHGRLGQPMLGLVFDGTGYGCDRTIWGGELLLLRQDPLVCDRVGHLGAVRLASGDAGIRNPVRTAALALLACGEPLDLLEDELTEAEHLALPTLLLRGSVTTSSMGRLFDVAASLLSVRHRITYEAQAAIELEALARRWQGRVVVPDLQLPVATDQTLAHGSLVGVLEVDTLIRQLAALARGIGSEADRGAAALAFHQAVATGSCELVRRAAQRHRISLVGLSGGVFANRILLSLLTTALTDAGMQVLSHRQVPAGDGGLSLGQAAIGMQAWQMVRDSSSLRSREV